MFINHGARISMAKSDGISARGGGGSGGMAAAGGSESWRR
jgi:hypothetical protein